MEFTLAPGATRPAPAPSPLASSYTLPTQPADAHIANKAPQTLAETALQPRLQRDEPAKRPDTVYTMYDDEDAYGGI